MLAVMGGVKSEVQFCSSAEISKAVMTCLCEKLHQKSFKNIDDEFKADLL